MSRASEPMTRPKPPGIVIAGNPETDDAVKIVNFSDGEIVIARAYFEILRDADDKRTAMWWLDTESFVKLTHDEFDHIVDAVATERRRKRAA